MLTTSTSIEIKERRKFLLCNPLPSPLFSFDTKSILLHRVQSVLYIKLVFNRICHHNTKDRFLERCSR